MGCPLEQFLCVVVGFVVDSTVENEELKERRKNYRDNL